MSLDVTTVATTGITSSGGTLRGSWFESNHICCVDPCCTLSQRWYYGTSNPPTTLTSAGSQCLTCDSCCLDVHAYSKSISGLIADSTYYVQANCAWSGCGGGGACSGQDNGNVLSFKTCANAMSHSIANDTPGTTTCTIKDTFNPNTVETAVTLQAQYKLTSEPTVWTNAGSLTGLKGTGAVLRSFALSGLLSSTSYDYRFVGTRSPGCGTTSLTSSVGTFVTAASAQYQTMADVEAAVDAFTASITGQAVVGAEELTLQETLEVFITSATDEKLTGVWFYHIPTRSYWFWSLSALTAGVSDTDADKLARTWISIGSEVFLLDDETYPYDDINQQLPLSDNEGTSMPLSLAPKALDGEGAYIYPGGLDAKWGADSDRDPVGKVDLDFVTDLYAGGPKGRRQLGTRRVNIAEQQAGVDEWRPFAVPRVLPANVVGLRFSFPYDGVPKRRDPIEISKIRVDVVRAPGRRRKV